MLRMLWGIPLWTFLVGAYALSLTLSFVVPQVFSAIAFDAGSIAVGAMTVTLLLPFAKGASGVIAGTSEEILSSAFGIVALIVVMPIITLQILGVVYRIKLSRISRMLKTGDGTVTILEFDREEAA